MIVLLGGNDALKRVPLEETFSRLGAIIDQLDETGAAVILVGVRGGLFADRYRSEFERLAREKQVNYVPDILNGIFGDPRLMSDPIHPNDERNARVADRLEPLLRELLGKP